ncbi:hypothetical protein AVEN_91100-1 [Araneus ventricosus]|uniref:ZP domain-containing protein n=1 Tax=Araneus ventricosus TaxID=182803 RepID=A0A4Y2JED1_ARAVE|nr:hypothetical protein AVEN_91100-1 [Araneus ventricosus]
MIQRESTFTRGTFRKIITGDDTWVPDTKSNTRTWKHPSSPVTKPAGVDSPKLLRILPQKDVVSPPSAWIKKFQPTVTLNPMTIGSFFIVDYSDCKILRCRNPQYRPIAPFHPQRDPNNQLAVSFVFKAFMFQNMLDGETLRLSAQVVACAELSDCQLAFCNGEAPRGKRRRKDVNNSPESETHSNIKNFTEDFKLAVTRGGFSQSKQFD